MVSLIVPAAGLEILRILLNVYELWITLLSRQDVTIAFRVTLNILIPILAGMIMSCYLPMQEFRNNQGNAFTEINSVRNLGRAEKGKVGQLKQRL